METCQTMLDSRVTVCHRISKGSCVPAPRVIRLRRPESRGSHCPQAHRSMREGVRDAVARGEHRSASSRLAHMGPPAMMSAASSVDTVMIAIPARSSEATGHRTAITPRRVTTPCVAGVRVRSRPRRPWFAPAPTEESRDCTVWRSLRDLGSVRRDSSIHDVAHFLQCARPTRRRCLRLGRRGHATRPRTCRHLRRPVAVSCGPVDRGLEVVLCQRRRSRAPSSLAGAAGSPGR